jgi:hypothetical protein
MLIKKADVKKHLAGRIRKYNTHLGIASAVSANSTRPFGSSIKATATPPPTEAVAPISISKST